MGPGRHRLPAHRGRRRLRDLRGPPAALPQLRSADACERADQDGDNVAEFTTVEEFERFFELNYRVVVGGKLRRKRRRYRAPAA